MEHLATAPKLQRSAPQVELLASNPRALEKLRAENTRLQELNAAGRIKELEEEREEVTAELLEMQQSKESTIQDLEKK